MSKPRFGIGILLLLFAFSASGGVIFSRRIYKTHGTSYQQLWMWNPADGGLKELTYSPRDHYRPACDGRVVKFVSGETELWTMDRATGTERAVGTAPEPAGRPDSRMGSCDQAAKLGELEACGNEETLVVSRSGRQVGRFQIEVDSCPIDSHGALTSGLSGKCETPIRSLDWSNDGKWLLIGEEGLNDGSGRRQDDYYLVDVAAMKLNTVASAYTAFWLPGSDRVLYVTPADLAPLPGGRGKHNIWVQQLMLFDPVKGRPTAITSGLSNNVDASWCEAVR